MSAAAAQVSFFDHAESLVKFPMRARAVSAMFSQVHQARAERAPPRSQTRPRLLPPSVSTCVCRASTQRRACQQGNILWVTSALPNIKDA